MKEEIKEWLKKAENDLKVAKDNLKLANYETTCFYSHQCAEKALKAAYITKYNSLKKIHDLVELAKDINAPTSIAETTDSLNPFYIAARYPGFDEPIDKKKATEAIKNAEGVLKWIKKKL